MILLGKPYVSPLLAETAARLQIPAMKWGEVSDPNEENLMFQSEQDFFHTYLHEELPLLANSENVIDALEKYIPTHTLVKQISLFKNKGNFRRWLQQMFPDFYYKECTLSDLQQIDIHELPFPIIVKPTVGYASLGVYLVARMEEWRDTCSKIQQDMREARELYPNTVLDTEHFIIEEWIQGEEFAVDAYFSHTGEPVILNIFKRMFAHDGDTSDRIYYTGKQVIKEALLPIEFFLSQLGQQEEFRKFPLHVEVRISDEGKVVPIEINPLRFAGIGTTDLGYYAFGINVYEYFFQQKKPDWDLILSLANDSFFSFFCAEFPVSLNMTRMTYFNSEDFRKNFTKIVSYRSLAEYDPTTAAVVFYESRDLDENRKLLRLDLEQYLRLPYQVQT